MPQCISVTPSAASSGIYKYICQIKKLIQSHASIVMASPLDSNNYITLHYITLHYITLQHITSHHITSHRITLHYITSNHITSHDSHHITSHRIASHQITSHHISPSINMLTTRNSTSKLTARTSTSHWRRWINARGHWKIGSLTTACSWEPDHRSALSTKSQSSESLVTRCIRPTV